MSKLSFLADPKALVLLVCLAAAGCAVEAAKAKPETSVENAGAPVVYNEPKHAPAISRGKIDVKPNSPADAVLAFYKDLREKRFRDAMMRTNYRPAIEPLSESELKELQPDFEVLATQIPQQIDINGEIIGDKKATVTAKMPNEETGKIELKEFKLRKENDSWIVLTGDEKQEQQAKREGKNYFFEMRIEIHQAEAKNMIQRIVKAEGLFALKNGHCVEIPELVSANFLAADVLTPDSTGYTYHLNLTAGGKSYFLTAEPAVYGKTGKLSYLFEADGNTANPVVKTADKKGRPLRM
jgi:hypothetical protein